jgi:hypothetical protein
MFTAKGTISIEFPQTAAQWNGRAAGMNEPIAFVMVNAPRNAAPDARAVAGGAAVTLAGPERDA